MMTAPLDLIKQNEKIHDAYAAKYNSKHQEIFNEVEQERLRFVVKELLSHFKEQTISVLDFGSGTGNLAMRFLSEGCSVVASDVSLKSLRLLKSRNQDCPDLDIVQIDGVTLPFNDNRFDVVALYSVLHHIPDYLSAMREIIRVVKPGGMIYVDHEANDDHWRPDQCLREYKALVRPTACQRLSALSKTGELFSAELFKTLFIKLFINRRYEREGDLHVWPDDHVEWEKIFQLLKDNHCEIVKNHDYLLYYPAAGNLYEKYKERCRDTKCMFAKKHLESGAI